MKPVTRVGLMAVCLAGAAWGTSRIPRLAARIDFFDVDSIALEGARFLERDDAVRAAGIVRGVNIWDDPSAWEAAIATHPLVRSARVRRRLPRTLVLEIQENRPVALLAGALVEPIDAEGRVLPIDPALHRLDLPIIRTRRVGDSADRALTASQRKTLLEELLRIGELDPEFAARISEMEMRGSGGVDVHMFAPDVTVTYAAPATGQRLREGMLALTDAIERSPTPPRHVDLRFANQVVVRYGRS